MILWCKVFQHSMKQQRLFGCIRFEMLLFIVNVEHMQFSPEFFDKGFNKFYGSAFHYIPEVTGEADLFNAITKPFARWHTDHWAGKVPDGSKCSAAEYDLFEV